MTTTPQTPGQLVRAVRERAGLTQAQLADRLGVRQGTVAEVETDRRGVTVERLARIAAALGAPLTITLGRVRLDASAAAAAEPPAIRDA